MSYVPPVYNAVEFNDVSGGAYTPPAYNAVEFDGADPGAALVAGLSATISRGVLVPSISVTLTGLSATVSRGALGPAIAVPLVGSAASVVGDVLLPSIDGNVSLALTGQQLTASSGTLSPSTTVALSGLAATMQQGFIPNSSALVGQVATINRGVLIPSVVVALTGLQATATPGTLMGGSVGDLVGQVATVSKGTLIPSITVALSGLSMTASSGSLASTISRTLTGSAATVSSGVLAAKIAVVPTGLAATISRGAFGIDVRYANPIIWSVSSHFSLTRYNDPVDSKFRVAYCTAVGPFVGIASYDGTTLGYRKEGKWYVEFVDYYGNPSWYAGILDTFRVVSGAHLGLRAAGGDDVTTWAFGLLPSTVVTTHNGTSTAQGSHTGAIGDVVMMAIDLDIGKIWFGLNGVWLGSGNPSTGTNPTYTFSVPAVRPMTPACSIGNATATLNGVAIRAALDAMTYVVPGGFMPWETSDLIESAALTGLSATISGGTIAPFNGVGVMVGRSVTISQGTLTPSIQITGILVGQSMTVKQMPFAVISAGANKSVQLYGLQATASVGVLAPTVKVGASAAIPATPAATALGFSGSGGDYFPPAEGAQWAAQNNFIQYDGKLLGAGDAGYKDVSGEWATQRRFGYSLDQATRDKTWGHAPWTTAAWDSPGDVNAFNAFFSGTGDHYAVGQVYDFSGGLQAHGGMFSVDLDGNLAFAHTRGYGLQAGRNNTTPDLVHYLQVSDITQVAWRRNSFTIDGTHEMLMGVYGHTPTCTLVFYPSLSGSDWVPTVRKWDGVTLSAAVQLSSFTGNGSCDARHKRFCAVRSGYGDTIYITYYSSTGHIGLIVMDAVTLTVTSHVLTAVVATGSVFEALSYGGEDLASDTTTRSLAEVVRQSGGTSVTQFLMHAQFVHLSWTSGTATTPTLTLKTGPASSYLVGGWESLESKGDEVVHVVFRRDVVSLTYNGATSRYDCLQEFTPYANDATGTGSSWAAPASAVWSWTESFTFNQLFYVQAIWFSGFGGGGQTVLYSAPIMAVGKPDSELQAKLAWFDYWAAQPTYASVSAKGRVGRVTVTIIPSITPTGLSTTISGGALVPSISVALTGLQASVVQGTLLGSPSVSGGATLSGSAATVAGGVLRPTISVTLTGLAAVASGGSLGSAIAVPLAGLQATAAKGALTPASAIALLGNAIAVSGGAFDKTVEVAPAGLSATISGGALGKALAVVPAGQQMMLFTGNFSSTVAVVLTGRVATVTEGSLLIALRVALLGRSATVSQGTVGYAYDCNLFPTGVWTTGMVGDVHMNTPLPRFDEHLWAQSEVEKLFNQIPVTDLTNDE